MKITLEYLDKIGACLAAESFYKAQKTESATKLIKAALDTGREDYIAYILCEVIDSDSLLSNIQRYQLLLETCLRFLPDVVTDKNKHAAFKKHYMPALERRAAGKELLKKQSQYLGKASCAVPYNAVAIAILNGPLETDVGYLSEAIECGWMCSHRTRLMYNKKAILYTCRRVIAMLKSNGITKL